MTQLSHNDVIVKRNYLENALLAVGEVSEAVTKTGHFPMPRKVYPDFLGKN